MRLPAVCFSRGQEGRSWSEDHWDFLEAQPADPTEPLNGQERVDTPFSTCTPHLHKHTVCQGMMRLCVFSENYSSPEHMLNRLI